MILDQYCPIAIARLFAVSYLQSTPVARHQRRLRMIRVHTLGGLSVRDGDGKPLTGPATQPRRMAILALLARAGDRGLTREKVLAQLWPDADDDRGPKALAQALYAL